MFFILMALPFFLCMFIDQLGLMLIVVPIYLPILKALEFDPVWFWLLFLLNITLGAITPPFGYVMFAVKAAAEDARGRRDSSKRHWAVNGQRRPLRYFRFSL